MRDGVTEPGQDGGPPPFPEAPGDAEVQAAQEWDVPWLDEGGVANDTAAVDADYQGADINEELPAVPEVPDDFDAPAEPEVLPERSDSDDVREQSSVGTPAGAALRAEVHVVPPISSTIRKVPEAGVPRGTAVEQTHQAVNVAGAASAVDGAGREERADAGPEARPAKNQLIVNDNLVSPRRAGEALLDVHKPGRQSLDGGQADSVTTATLAAHFDLQRQGTGHPIAVESASSGRAALVEARQAKFERIAAGDDSVIRDSILEEVKRPTGFRQEVREAESGGEVRGLQAELESYAEEYEKLGFEGLWGHLQWTEKEIKSQALRAGNAKTEGLRVNPVKALVNNNMRWRQRKVLVTSTMQTAGEQKAMDIAADFIMDLDRRYEERAPFDNNQQRIVTGSPETEARMVHLAGLFMAHLKSKGATDRGLEAVGNLLELFVERQDELAETHAYRQGIVRIEPEPELRQLKALVTGWKLHAQAERNGTRGAEVAIADDYSEELALRARMLDRHNAEAELEGLHEGRIPQITARRIEITIQAAAVNFFYKAAAEGLKAQQELLADVVQQVRDEVTGRDRVGQLMEEGDAGNPADFTGNQAFTLDELYQHLPNLSLLIDGALQSMGNEGGATGVRDIDAARYAAGLAGMAAVAATEIDGATEHAHLSALHQSATEFRRILFPANGRYLCIYGAHWGEDGQPTPVISSIAASGLADEIVTYGSGSPTQNGEFRRRLKQRTKGGRPTEINEPTEGLQEGREFTGVIIEGKVSKASLDVDEPEALLDLIGHNGFGLIPMSFNPELTRNIVTVLSPELFNPDAGVPDSEYVWAHIPSMLVRMREADGVLQFAGGHAAHELQDRTLLILRAKADGTPNDLAEYLRVRS